MAEQDKTAMLTVVGLGEALFDRFSPDRLVLGGAPVNVAVQAHQLLHGRGGGIVASGIGDDPLGKRLLDELAQRGMRTDCVTVSDRFPTGTVEVQVDEHGGPSYEICENVAWDHLHFAKPWQKLAPECWAVCFGTLAQRSPESREAIRLFLLNAPQALHVLDLNLRQSYYSAEIIHESLLAADVLKLNEEEIAIVSEVLEVGDPVIDFEKETKRPLTVDVLFKRYDLEAVAVTRGQAGTTLFTLDGRFDAAVPRFPQQANADSVGAGDACCAAIVVGLLLHKAPEEIVDLANHAGAYVASQAGATPELPEAIWSRVA